MTWQEIISIHGKKGLPMHVSAIHVFFILCFMYELPAASDWLTSLRWREVMRERLPNIIWNCPHLSLSLSYLCPSFCDINVDRGFVSAEHTHRQSDTSKGRLGRSSGEMKEKAAHRRLLRSARRPTRRPPLSRSLDGLVNVGTDIQTPNGQ